LWGLGGRGFDFRVAATPFTLRGSGGIASIRAAIRLASARLSRLGLLIK
jgi:hypothetical protein